MQVAVCIGETEAMRIERKLWAEAPPEVDAALELTPQPRRHARRPVGRQRALGVRDRVPRESLGSHAGELDTAAAHGGHDGAQFKGVARLQTPTENGETSLGTLLLRRGGDAVKGDQPGFECTVTQAQTNTWSEACAWRVRRCHEATDGEFEFQRFEGELRARVCGGRLLIAGRGGQR